jgi:hypothetical protein
MFSRLTLRIAILALLATVLSLASTGASASPHVERAPAAAVPSLVGAAVTFGGGTYPRATRLSDGSLLGVYTAFTNGNNVLTTVKSTDNGASWTSLGSITTEVSATHDTDNPFVLQLPNGSVLAAFRNHDKNSSSGAYTTFRIVV